MLADSESDRVGSSLPPMQEDHLCNAALGCPELKALIEIWAESGIFFWQKQQNIVQEGNKTHMLSIGMGQRTY